MKDFADRYVTEPGRVADVGAYDFNGNYRAFFPACEYTGIDLGPGPNIDRVVTPDDFGEGGFDVVVSGQCMEHVEDLRQWVAQCIGLAKPGGVLCIIAPNTWPEHRHPVDCWRIYPDGMRWAFRELEILECRTVAEDTIMIARRPLEPDTVVVNDFLKDLDARVASAIAERRHDSDPTCQAVVKAFNQIYYGTPGAPQLFNTIAWRGVGIWKCPEDIFIYQEIIHRTRPDVIVEFGISYAASTLFLADMCELNGHGEVIGVDISLHNACKAALDHPRITLIQGNSAAVETAARVKQEVLARGAQRVMVILDSDHVLPHVQAELTLYAPLVTPGCYLIVEDTNIHGHPIAYYPPGPYEAVEEFLKTHPEFERDAHCERLLVTFNPGGYLLRK
jgi:cephalosporin hydroxylase